MSVDLSQHENLILNIVQEYLSLNKFFDMKKVLPFIQSVLRSALVDLNTRAIEEILRSLVKKRLIVEGTKLTKNDILVNETRNKIYNYILKNPGSYFNKIVIDLNINKPVVVWHVKMLERFGYIKREVFENHAIFFDTSLTDKKKKVGYFTSNEKSKRIIEYLKLNDFGITKTNLSNDLGMHHNTVSKYLKKLEEFNVIIKKKTPKQTLYFLNEELLETMHLKL
ncbi:MAG: winged helix-turn-helix transcriptional regulator [Promethearchaeota archaeon]